MNRTFVVFAIALLAVVGGSLLWHGGSHSLVVYCAHDSIFSESILRDFERRSGVPVAIRFDTEATKSLGLVELILQEKAAPRCDVFWNNEPLGTMQLADAGLLLPYRGPGYARIPADFKDADARWTGFAARLRVYIVNTGKLAADDAAIARTLAAPDLSRVAIAKPLYGTTLAHYTALWAQMGAAGLQAWHRDTRKRGMCEADGNSGVKNLVAQGVCDLGFTDTDDFYGAKDDGAPVAARPVRLPDGHAICLPNTVAIIKGTQHLAEARKLVDFLLSEETEMALARGKSRQIPLGPVPVEQLPTDVRELKAWSQPGVSLSALQSARADCLAWLKQVYLQE